MTSIEQVAYQILTTVIIIGLAWYFDLKRKVLSSAIAIAALFGLGLSYAGQGIADLNSAGAINAILIFESAKQSRDQAAFDHLHSTLDPLHASGFVNSSLGGLMIVVSLAFGLYLLLKKSL